MLVRNAAPTLTRLTVNVGGSASVRTETLDGQEYLVVPTVMLTEGVHEGDQGRLLYRRKVWNETSPPAGWDHKPAVLYHPTAGTACSSSVLATRGMGLLLNTAGGDKLRTDVWVNRSKSDKLDARVVARLQNNQMIEVSTGLFVTTDNTPGTWNGQQYDAEVISFVPDHLAVLPDKIGACSIAKGAGMLQLNQQPEGTAEALDRSVRRLAQVHGLLVGNELSFDTTRAALYDLLAGRFGQPGKYWSGWVSDVFADRVIFQTEDRYDGRLFALDYAVGPGDVVSLSPSDPVEVVRQTTYQPTNNQERPTVNRDQKIAQLVANGYAGKEDWLKKLDDATLQGIQPVVVQNASPSPAPKPPATVQEYIAAAPAAMQAVLNHGLAEYQGKRDKLVANVVANPNNKFDKTFLEAQSVEFLERLSDLATPPAPPAGTPTNNAAQSDDLFTRYYGHAHTFTQPLQPVKNDAAAGGIDLTYPSLLGPSK